MTIDLDSLVGGKKRKRRRKFFLWKPARGDYDGRHMWFSPDLNKRYNSSFLKDLLKNEEGKVRKRYEECAAGVSANLVGSYRADKKKHYPLVDLDWPHEYVPSSHGGHGHLWLNVGISRWRWVILMFGLYFGRVISFGYLAWSLRRGQNFVRLPHIRKEGGLGDGPYT